MFKRIFRELCQTLFRQPGLAAAAEPFIRLLWPWYSAEFYTAKVVRLQSQGGCLRVQLKVRAGYPQFSAGQHLQLRVDLNGVATQRTFSICSPEWLLREEGLLELAIQIQPEGRFTSALTTVLRTGSYVHLTGPQGDFAFRQDKPACLIAAGTGVTPLFAMLNAMSRLTQPMQFIYCYRGTERQLFSEAWSALKTKFPLLELVLWDSATLGRFTAEKLFSHSQPSLQGRFYLCGPQAFTTMFTEALQQRGVTQSQIHSESFGGIAKTSGVSQPVTLQLGPFRHQLLGAGSILQRAEDSGLSLAYGCRRGVCMQCLCEKSHGVVRNLLTGELSDAGPGFIQLCISEAVSAVEIQSQGFGN